MESLIEGFEIPACPSEEACRLISNFLETDVKEIAKDEIGKKLYVKRENDKLLLRELKSHLKALRKEENRIIIEMYKLKNSLNFIKED